MPASQRPYMGAIIYPGGTTFRVWAPFAQNVYVAGSFNGWKQTDNPLSSENNGYWSADIAGAKEGDTYKFLISNPNIDGLLWRNDPYARSVDTDNNSAIIARNSPYPQSDYKMPAWNELVIYELHVGTFLFDKNSPNKIGTFSSVCSKLDYLKDLGVNAIEVMVPEQFETSRSWGYNPAYIFAIENQYGGPEAFREFVKEAHGKGIAVILDVVYGHLGTPAADMWQFDGWSQDDAGGIYFYNDWRKHTNYGETRLDYGRPEVRQFIRDNAMRWLEDRFVDGLRFDSTGSIRNVFDQNNDPAHDLPDGWSLLQRLNNEIDQRQPWKITIAEDMKDNDWLTKDVSSGGAGFDSQWDPSFLYPMRNALIASNDSDRDMYMVKSAIEHGYNGNWLERVIYTESHDADANGASRVPEQIWAGHADSYFSKKRSTLGAAILFSSPGIPMIFQGQEFLENGSFQDTTQLDWSKADRYSGILALYRDLMHLRRDFNGTTRGLKGANLNVHHVNNTNKVIAYHRWDSGGSGDDVVIVANFGDTGYASYNVGFPRGGRWRVRINTDWNGYSDDFSDWSSYDTDAGGAAADGMPCSADVGIGPYTVIMLSQD